MSFTPSPGSLVRIKGQGYGLITKVTPDGHDRVVLLGTDYGIRLMAWEIEEVIFEAESNPAPREGK